MQYPVVKEFLLDLLDILLPVFAGLLPFLFSAGLIILAGYLAMLRYFWEKEHEQNRQRYLEGTFDGLIFDVESALQISRHNWANSLTVMKAIRDARTNVDANICTDRFREMDPAVFRTSPITRL